MEFKEILFKEILFKEILFKQILDLKMKKSPKAELEKPPQLESKFINECSELAMECLRSPGVRNSDWSHR